MDDAETDTAGSNNNPGTEASSEPPPPAENDMDDEAKANGSGGDGEGESSSSSNEEDDDDEKDNKAPVLDPDGRELSEYERLRLERIERNKAYLQQLGLHEVQPQPKRRVKKKDPSEAVPLVKSRFSSRATKQTVVSYTEPSLSVAALVRKEKAKKEPKEKKPPKEPKPPREKKPVQPRLERNIYDEFQRINKHKKLIVKHVDRDVRAAEKEIKFWTKRVELLDRREQRKAEASTREHLVDQERQVLGGLSKRELLQQVDSKMEEIIALADKYDEEFEAEELARERKIQRMEIEAKNKTLNALDRFPKALHDSHSLLNTILLQRLPKDPPPPRRSRRSTGPETIPSAEDDATPPRKRKARRSKGDEAVLDRSPSQEWHDAQGFQDTSLAVADQYLEEEQSGDPAPQAATRIRTRSIRNVGGWISPNMAKLVDRSWLERDTPMPHDQALDFSTYAPQVGEAVLYYPMGHKEWLAVHPDVLGKKLRSAQRVPLWERPSQKDEADSKVAADGTEWWSQQWLDSLEDGTGNYPILCRVEKCYAEFPPDPFTKVMKKTGNDDPSQIVWKPPKDPAVLKQAKGAPLRLALILKPLSAVAPPSPTDAYSSLVLPPTFSVVTFPSVHKPFIIPFSYAYTIWHSLDVNQKVVHEKSKVQIRKFSCFDDGESCRFRDKISEIGSVLKQLEKAVSMNSFLDKVFVTGAKGLPTRDCRIVVEAMQNFMQKHISESEGSSKNCESVDIMSLITRTLPLWNGVCSAHGAQNRKEKWVSAWEVKFSGMQNLLESCTPDGLASKGFDEALRRRIETVVEDFAWDDPDAGDLFYYTIDDEVASSYSCAVPVSMSLERILTRFGNDSDSETGCYYRSVEHVLSDISLILENCLLYNAPESAVVESASVTIPRLKELVCRASQSYFQELRDARKAEEERKKLVMSISTDVASSSVAPDSTFVPGTLITTIRQPYNETVNQEWLQEMRSKGDLWVPQTGDYIEYSPTRHATFVQGHYRSLETDQCFVSPLDENHVGRNGDEWIQGKLIWTRASFPKASSRRSSNDSMTFPSTATLMVLGIQTTSHGSIFAVHYRPCSMPDEAQLSASCPSCGLNGSSFVRLHTARATAHVELDHNQTSQEAAHVQQCLGFLKKRCIKGDAPSLLDSGLDKASVKQGYRVPKVKLPLKNLPSFQKLLFGETSDSNASSLPIKGTRGVKINLAFTAKKVHENQHVGILSASGFLPAWAAQPGQLDKCKAVSPWPKMSLELVQLRLKNGYYRHREAIVNDIVESFVSQVCLVLAEPVSRKIRPLQAKRVARLSTKSSLEAPLKVSVNAAADEEYTIATCIKRIRDVHAVALVAASDTPHFECLFGLDDDTKPPQLSSSVVKTSPADKDPQREEARRKISLLLDAVGKDQLLNIFGQKFHGERASIPDCTLRVKVEGLAVCHARYLKSVSKASAEMEDGRTLSVTIRANRKVISWLEDQDDDDCEDDETEDGISNGAVSKLHDVRVNIVCDGKGLGRSNESLTAAVPGHLGDPSLVRKVDDAIRLSMKEYESSDSLAKFVFQRPGRTEPCARCQAFRRSFFTCRVRRSHSNPDYDWCAHFGGSGSDNIDHLLVTLDPSYTPPVDDTELNLPSSVDKAGPTTKSHASINKPSEHDEDEEAIDDDDNKDDEIDIADPREQLQKAEFALRFGKALLKQAQAYAERPVRLSKEFIQTVYPVDPSDNHYIYCIICGLSGDLLCCDGCSNVFHSECLALKEVPEDEWFCEECTSSKAPQSSSSTSSAKSNDPSSSGEPMSDNMTGQLSTSAPPVEQMPDALVDGPFQRTDFNDTAADKLNRLLFELNEARPERLRAKSRSEESGLKEETTAIQKRLFSQRSSSEGLDAAPSAPPAKRRERKAASERVASPIRPKEDVVELEASSFGRKRSRPQFLAENTMIGNFYASAGHADNDMGSPRVRSRRSLSDSALWDDPFDRLNANAQAFLGTLDIANADEFLGTRTVDIADAFIKWRQKQKLPPLKGTGAVATISAWKTLCREAAKEMGKDMTAALLKNKKRRTTDESPESKKKSRRGRAAKTFADPFEALSATAQEFLRSVNVDTAEALLGTKSSDLAEELVLWREAQEMPPLKGTGAIATISGWKAQCRKVLDVEDDSAKAMSKAVKASSGKSVRGRSTAKMSQEESESDEEDEDEEEVDKDGASDEPSGKVPAGDPLLGLPSYAQSFLASRGITTASEFLETKSSEIAQVYVKWRKRQGMPELKGSGPGAHIGAWKSIARKPSKSTSKKRKVESDAEDNDA